MKKYPVVLFVLVVAFAPICNAADYGLGVSVKSFETTVFLPINLNNNYRVEPYLQYYHIEEGEEKEVQQSGYKVKRTTQEVGIGIFKALPMQENISTYFGLRVSYVEREWNFEDWYNTYHNTKSKLTGYSISPAIGFEYSFTKKFVLGIEAEWRYQNIDGKREEDIQSVNAQEKTTGTNTRVAIRYFF